MVAKALETPRKITFTSSGERILVRIEKLEPMKTKTSLIGLLALAGAFVPGNLQAFQAHVVLAQSGTNYTYTLFNDEAAGSSAYLNTFYLPINAPVSVVSSPPGWSFTTDGFTYVNWFSTDAAMPYPNDIAPGASVSGFAIQTAILSSEAFDCALGSWDHTLTNSGPSNTNLVPAPSVFGDSSAVPPVLNSVSYSASALQFTLSGIPSFNYTIQSSTNLTDWASVLTNAAPFSFADTNAFLPPLRFYRSILSPDARSLPFLAD